ncbi:hypothetical protein [Halosimplex amylolyticum]|uniref:hypothetical protein n=1 Tax=Halosimplex amylolyticum TaxID=3396616 RepID=UPI003F55CF9D
MTDPANVQAAEEAQVESDEGTEERAREVDTSHLDDVEDGCGCAEVWEHLSDERDE